MRRIEVKIAKTKLAAVSGKAEKYPRVGGGVEICFNNRPGLTKLREFISFLRGFSFTSFSLSFTRFGPPAAFRCRLFAIFCLRFRRRTSHRLFNPHDFI